MAAMPAIAHATCPHNKVMAECAHVWCRGRIEDLGRNPAPSNARQLIRHMVKHYSDWHIDNDLDCVLSTCESAKDRQAVLRYAAARRGVSDFDSRSHAADRRHNSHQPWMLPTADETNARCANPECGRQFKARRRDARFCSGSCRVASHRQKALCNA